MIEIRAVRSKDEIGVARQLFAEYAESLDFGLGFQDFDRELASLPGSYAAPRGGLWLAMWTGEPAGCAALRPLSDGIGELKRFYVRPACRGRGIGRRLAETCIGQARAIGYGSLRLDTVPAMAAAIALYESLGFRDIAPYCENPIAGARFMELELE